MSKHHRVKSGTWIWISPLIALLLACSVTFSTVQPTPSTMPVAESATGSPTPLLSEQVTLNSVPFTETDPGSGFPAYSITARIPQLTGSDNAHVLSINQRLEELVMGEVDVWRGSFKSLPITPVSNGSILEVKYTLVSQLGDLWSFKFDFAFYSDGAAHPGLNSITLNYDLGMGRELGLDDLFLPHSRYLEAIAQYCVTELRKQPYSDSFTLNGTQPTLQNFRNWNITMDGLMITFDEYQVAPYAAGPQTVVVPYGELTEFIDPQGPLAILVKGG